MDKSGKKSTWPDFWKKMKILAPFLWPKKDKRLQCRVIICFLVEAITRVINLYVPIFSKLIVDSMANESDTGAKLNFRWDLILIFVSFKLLQGGDVGSSMSFLSNLRSFLWIPIEQYTIKEAQVDLFRHLHSLSLRWHLGRKTGEVLRVMDRGTGSINDLLNVILFSIFPSIVDMIVAIVYFVVVFDYWFAVIVAATIVFYLVASFIITECLTKFNRIMNQVDNETRARSVDSLLNFETVKYYGSEDYEVDAFKAAISRYQIEDFKCKLTYSFLKVTQNLVICGSLLAGSLLCVYLVVSRRQLKVGDYVLFATYISQLHGPLRYFGSYYAVIQKNFVDMENMFDLFRQEREIVNAPNSTPVNVEGGGGIFFSKVSFRYLPEKLVLKNVTFAVPPGKTVALVGPSGSGKTTVIRLLFRFYDIETGSILIDGQNIKDVTHESLRRAVGVVPQDTVLFNNTILHNIKYGRLAASDDDVKEAARDADIHDQILTFPNEYYTEVGERGLRLSGGEKQRIAIARTLLKDPQIILLDEATSALDTQTERKIQEALYKVFANRTTIIVAHRLSTVIHADEILVLKDGEIIERGKHDDLIVQNGIYTSMWKQQLVNKGTTCQ